MSALPRLGAIRVGHRIRLRDTDIHVLDEGAGPLVICLSGLGGAWYDWQPFADRLLPDHRVVRVDRPGAGLSGPSAPVLSGAAESDRLALLLHALPPVAGAHPRAIVVAHSLGGFVGELLARRRPDLVAHLVLLDTSIEDEWSGRSPAAAGSDAVRRRRIARCVGARGWAPWARTVADLAWRRAYEPAARRALPGAARAVYGRRAVVDGVATELASYRTVGDEVLTTRVEPLRCPVTVVAAQRRRWGPPTRWVGRQRGLAETLRAGGARVEVHVVRGSGHALVLDRPGEAAAIVRGLAAR